MSDIAVFAASDLEFRAIRSLLTRSEILPAELLAVRGLCGHTKVDLFCTAMGPANAAAQAARAFKISPAPKVLVSGFAGGLDPQARCGDLVLYQSCQFSDGNEISSIDCHAGLNRQLADNLQHAGVNLHSGRGLTMPRMLCRVAEKQEIGARHQALAVDMESYQIIAAATAAGRVAAVLRVLSDDVHGELPDLNAGLSDQAEVNNLKMILLMAAHPLRAIRFLINLRRALKALKIALPCALNLAHDLTGGIASENLHLTTRS